MATHTRQANGWMTLRDAGLLPGRPDQQPASIFERRLADTLLVPHYGRGASGPPGRVIQPGGAVGDQNGLGAALGAGGRAGYGSDSTITGAGSRQGSSSADLPMSSSRSPTAIRPSGRVQEVRPQRIACARLSLALWFAKRKTKNSKLGAELG